MGLGVQEQAYSTLSLLDGRTIIHFIHDFFNDITTVLVLTIGMIAIFSRSVNLYNIAGSQLGAFSP